MAETHYHSFIWRTTVNSVAIADNMVRFERRWISHSFNLCVNLFHPSQYSTSYSKHTNRTESLPVRAEVRSGKISLENSLVAPRHWCRHIPVSHTQICGEDKVPGCFILGSVYLLRLFYVSIALRAHVWSKEMFFLNLIFTKNKLFHAFNDQLHHQTNVAPHY